MNPITTLIVNQAGMKADNKIANRIGHLTEAVDDMLEKCARFFDVRAVV